MTLIYPYQSTSVITTATACRQVKENKCTCTKSPKCFSDFDLAVLLCKLDYIKILV